MDATTLKFCAGCCHLRKVPSSNEERYCCILVIDDIPDGRVYLDTDASKCIRKGRYLPKRN